MTMNPMMRVLGVVLRLVGVSSPEDTRPGVKNEAGPPSWRKPAKPESPVTQDQEK
jgi:hypothetical protein